jgi:hypothetical protein
MIDEHATPPPIAPLTTRPGPPPLRIHHLLLWMTATALFISAVLWFDHGMRNGPPIKNITVNAALTAMAIAASGALSCGGLGVYWRRRGYAFPVEPGEQLVALVAAGIVGFVATTILSLVVFFMVSHTFFPSVWFMSRFAVLFALAIWCLYGARPRCDTLPWRILFDVFAALLLVAPYVGESALVVAAIVVLVLLVIAAGNDRRRNTRRNWMHWFGVGVLAVIVLSCGVISLIPAAEHWQASGWLRWK